MRERAKQAALIAMVLVMAATGLGTADDAEAARPAPRGTTLPDGAPNPGVSEFRVECTFSHRDTVDPIVDRGNPDFAHLHDFFGNRTTDEFSTPRRLRGGPTSCRPRANASAYWIPTLLDDGVPVNPDSLLVYYSVRYPQDPAKVRPLPRGLRLIAGDARAMSAQPDHVIQWQCVGGEVTNSPTIPDCGNDQLQLLIEFPDCWDGRSRDSADHKSHLAYSRGQDCPLSHPVLVAQLSFRIRWSVSGEGVTLSSDAMHHGGGTHRVEPGMTAHGDFVNGWKQKAFRKRVLDCLRAVEKCDVRGRPS
jgi:hypothetical protein